LISLGNLSYLDTADSEDSDLSTAEVTSVLAELSRDADDCPSAPGSRDGEKEVPSQTGEGSIRQNGFHHSENRLFPFPYDCNDDANGDDDFEDLLDLDDKDVISQDDGTPVV